MRTVDVLPVGAEYVLVGQVPAVLNVSRRTLSRYIRWAVDAELKPFEAYQLGRPLSRHQMQALRVIQQGRKLGQSDHAIARCVNALSKPRKVGLDEFEGWLRRRLPAEYVERFVVQMREDFADEATEICD